MNCFEKMIDDVFAVPQFQTFFIDQNGNRIIAIVFQTTCQTIYTEFGVDTGISFYLTCKVADYQPKKGAKITYNGKEYKIDQFSTDSFGLSHNIFLRSLTSK